MGDTNVNLPTRKPVVKTISVNSPAALSRETEHVSQMCLLIIVGFVLVGVLA